ncbi:MAG: HAD-IIIA family hydrolase [Chitinivibrionales bacterium]|nr:HAD-IIIA family hydrolase [Chitinivibrionales bacterium]
MKQKRINRAVFLDRDGTIIEDRGHLSDKDDVAFFPFAIRALKILQEKFLLFIVTNQSGVSLGKITKESVDTVNTALLTQLQHEGVTIEQLYTCSHARRDNCECMKPKPYFINKAMSEFDLDIAHSYTVGDHPHDVEFGAACGATGIYVLTGHGQKHLEQLPSGAQCFENLLHAAQWIINK